MLKIFVENKSNRLLYVLDLVLNQVGGIQYEIVTDAAELKPDDQVINYSGRQISGSFQIHPHGLLFEKDIQVYDIPFEYRSDSFLVSIFPTEFDDLGFDIFSASFYITSRYEEYRKFEADEHGRYTSVNSLQKKVGILKRPIVNIWVEEFKRLLSEKWKLSYPEPRKFQVINTIDVDVAFAYSAKGWVRSVGGLSKEILTGHLTAAKKRLIAVSGKEKDPLDTYDYIREVAQQYERESIFFLLLGDYKKPYDTANNYNSVAFKNMVKHLTQFSEIGIHPSYFSYLNESKLQKEIARLKALAPVEKIIARKHFLRLSIPDSYRLMEKAGISEDYTMGYADEVGFRAGLCSPFQPFDLLLDRPLNLMVHPFAYMDGTLKDYMKLSPEESKQKVQFLKEQVRNVNGEFIGVWHNTSLTNEGEWKGWREVFELSLSK